MEARSSSGRALNSSPALCQALCPPMLESQIQIRPTPHSGCSQPKETVKQTETATAQGDRAYDKGRRQRLWEPLVNPVQGRRDPVGFLEKAIQADTGLRN